MNEEMIEKVAVAMQKARDEIGATEHQRIAFGYAEAAMREALSAYNPNERLREALLGAQRCLLNLADEGAISSRAPILKFIAAALSPLPQGED